MTYPTKTSETSGLTGDNSHAQNLSRSPGKVTDLFAKLDDWRNERMEMHRKDRREAIAVRDKESAAGAVFAMLELHELGSFLVRAQNTGEGGLR